MQKFSEQNELIRFAKQFVTERLDALEKDVNHCLAEPYAPFPAILFCFSTIDLLGALSSGNASRKAPTAHQAEEYMRRFMHYTEQQSRLLMKIFRHKIVHLAQPRAVIEEDGKKIVWQYWHNNAKRHLKLTILVDGIDIPLTSTWVLTAEHKFEISIAHLVRDVVSSVREPGGYFYALQTDTDLQDRFEKAVSEIYGNDI